MPEIRNNGSLFLQMNEEEKGRSTAAGRTRKEPDFDRTTFFRNCMRFIKLWQHTHRKDDSSYVREGKLWITKKGRSK